MSISRRRRIAWSAVALVVAAALGACAGVPSQGGPTADVSTADDPAAGPPSVDPPAVADPAAYAEQIVAETNVARLAQGLPELAASSCAREMAVERATALVGSPELVHADLAPVHAACAPPSGTAAENLSRADAPAADVVAAWLASPGHANNLLALDLTHLGVGCVPDGAELLCAQIFLG
ncbi:SCP-like extracellular [Xylanimonas cellulosilytica DSM 15894]|uniref:SCP-like extracellular n=1 Tax=Xylanimonas cellulosilytica (strain DSM 15894 / JCM 12276 / CECT 5975 / KCTC 9989 / LMG 20990 / NBRC 107835 / XIL07) TaxID=446471 RepID=D1BYJ4_XYLCX|nr:CAP domain-containing protein [Xylanimonas cellulosilytica]ACZ31866.1 SCP-like extracellular [Xylanimonas cellulosilytica DSM 15894]